MPLTITCYCGVEFTPRPGAKFRCPLCRAAKAALRHGPPALDYLSRRSRKEAAQALDVPVDVVRDAEATALAKIRELGKTPVGETFGGRHLTPELRKELRDFRAVLAKLEEAGAVEEATAVKQILDTLDRDVREITNAAASQEDQRKP